MIPTLRARLHNWLWFDIQQQQCNGLNMRLLLRYVYVIVDDLVQGQLTMRAMSLVYTSLLSIVPLMAVSFSVLKAFGVHDRQLEPLLKKFLAPMGAQGQQIIQQIMEFIDNARVGVLGSFGLILLFYIAISLLQKIENTFNYVWRLQQHRSLGRRITDYITVMMVGPVVVFAALGLFANVLGGTLIKDASQFQLIAWLVAGLSKLLPYLMMMAAFTFFYMFIPNTKVELRAGVIAGIVSGALWQSLGWVFATIIVSATHSSAYAIYSGFAILVLFMMWVYLSWLILLVGGSIAFYVQCPEYLVPMRYRMHLSNQQKEQLALRVLAIAVQHHYSRLPALTAESLYRKWHFPMPAVLETVSLLKKANILVENCEFPPAYVLNVPAETTSLKQILDIVRTADAMPMLLPEAEEIDRVIDRALETALQGITLKAYAFAEH